MDLPEAPIFRPTLDEWADPLAYISTVVRRSGCEARFGICKIVPPEGWAPPFAIDKRRLKFPTRLQAVHQLQSRDTSAALKQFWDGYNDFLRASGTKHKKNPTFAGQEIDLYRLFRVVNKRGGYHVVTEDKGWRDVASSLQLNDKSGSVAYTLRQHYQKLLLPYDEHLAPQNGGAAGLLAAAMEAELSDGMKESPALEQDPIDDDEAAEILEAMLGLGEVAAPPKKKRKSSAKGEAPGGAGAIKVPENIFTMVCEKCKGGHYEDQIILCDRCDKGWHMFCLSPPLEIVPEGDWICPSCVATEFEGYAFREGDAYTLEAFERIASNFEREWFNGEAAAAKATNAEREAEFWRVVEDGEDEAEALYGADLDSMKVGSGFPRAPPLGTSTDPHALSPWNLNNLPRAGGDHASLLRLLEGNVAGMTVPWMYMGMMFSSFCWHVEDHQFYSINYNHWGGAKRWYGVPAHAAGLFEAAFKAALPDQVAAQPDLLFHLVTMLSPRILKAYGVPLCATTQEPGTFVLTFPNAYHAGINLGVNCAEAVNFAPADWLRFGALSLSRYRHFRKPCVISHERLLLKIAQQCVHGAGQGAEGDAELPSGRTCYWVSRELKRVVDEERVMRAKLWSEGLRRSRRVQAPVGMRAGDKDDASCAVCHLYLHLSAVECDCCPRRRTCVHHASNLCECPMRRRRLAWRHTLPELEAAVAAVAARVPPELAAAVEQEEEELAALEREALTESLAAATSPEAAAIAAGPADMEVQPEAEPAQAAAATPQDQELDAKAEAKPTPTKGQRGGKGRGRGAKVKAEQPPEPSPAKVEPAADLEETLAGFMTELASGTTPPSTGRKRPRSSADGILPLLSDPTTATLVSTNGFVQGPVRPFAPLDVYPEDREAASDWLSSLAQGFAGWLARVEAALQQGGALAADLPGLVEEGEQYVWGGDDAAQAAKVAQVEPRLRAAAEYVTAINSALKGKPSLDAVEELLSAEPKPLESAPGLDKLGEAVDAAREWQRRYSGLLDPELGAVETRALEAAANEASRLPVTLPEARSLRERLSSARKVAEAIRTVLPTSREAGRRRRDEATITVDYLRQLHAQAAATRVEMPEATNLATALDRLDAWQERARALAGVRAPLADLRELVEESEALPAALAEVDHLVSLIDKGEAWLRQAASLTRSRAPLKKLRDLLHAGLRLPVETPEVEQLRLDIRRREWEDSARRATNAKGTLHALLEALATAADMGAENGDLALALRAKVATAESWDMAAAAFLEQHVTADDLEEGERPSVDQIAELVSEGLATGVKMDRLAYLSNQLTAMTKWLVRARQCLPAEPDMEGEDEHQGADAGGAKPQQPQQPFEGDAQPAEPSESEYVDIDDSGGGHPGQAAQAMEVDAAGTGDADMRGAVEEQREEAEPPKPAVIQQQNRQQRTQQQQQPRHVPVPHLDVVTSLLDEYDNSLITKATEADGLRALRQAAEVWLEAARPVLEQEYVVDEQLPLLRLLIADGKACGVAMEQLDILEANVEALVWGQHVRALLARLPELPPDKSLRQEPPPAAAAAAPVAPQAAAAASEQASTTPAAAGLGLPPPDADPSDSDDDRPALARVPYDQRPHLVRLAELLEEGSILPCDEALYAKFRRYAEAAQDWERQARTALTVTKDGSPAALVAVRDLRKALTRGERLALQLPSLPRLYEVLRAHEKWEQRVRDLMASAGERPPFAELQVFQQTARLSPVTSNLRLHIDSTVEAIQEWVERCRRLVAKRNTGMRLDRCLEVLSHSVDCGVEQFERRLEVEKRLVAAGGRRAGPPGSNGAEEDERELYCLCQQPYHVDTTMISCDACGEWYHMRCVGVTQSQARSLRKYVCPICAAVRNNLDPLELALNKLRRTRRPERSELGTLLEEVKRLPVTLDEEGQLERLLTKWDRWATATNRAVEVHEASRLKDSGGAILPLSEGMLHQLLKSALAMELDGTEHAERILHLLRCNRWRARVESALGASSSGSKAGVEVIGKLLLEAERHDIDARSDVAGAKLLEAAEATRVWQESARAAIAALKASGSDRAAFDAAAGRAKELMKEAEALPLRVDKDVESLGEYSKPYCLCRRPYDDQIPMLECDHCAEWFHFDCVGLRGPGTEGGGEELPEHYRCPTCCMQLGAKYPYFHRLPQASMDALKEVASAMAPPPQPAVPAVPQGVPAAAAAMAMYPQGWPFAGMQQGMQGMQSMPMQMVHPGMLTPQALQSMMDAFPGMAAMQGFMPAGMVHPGMFGMMHPGMVPPQAAVAAAAAAAAAGAPKEDHATGAAGEEVASGAAEEQEQEGVGGGVANAPPASEPPPDPAE